MPLFFPFGVWMFSLHHHMLDVHTSFRLYRDSHLRNCSRLKGDSELTILNNVGTVKDYRYLYIYFIYYLYLNIKTVFKIRLCAFCIMRWPWAHGDKLWLKSDMFGITLTMGRLVMGRLILIVNLKRSGMTLETDLWASLWRIFHIRLIEVGRTVLTSSE